MESHRCTNPNAAAHAQHSRPALPRIEKLLDDFRSPPIRRRVRKTDEDERNFTRVAVRQSRNSPKCWLRKIHMENIESWRFPSRNTGVGQMISSYLANDSHLDDHAIHLLFSANRWEKRSLMESKVRSGTTLIVDRYSFSEVPNAGLLAPDLVVYLDISPEVHYALCSLLQN
ncbi:hypothetical protein ACS0TY_001456 [Phlomoides rotata]